MISIQNVTCSVESKILLNDLSLRFEPGKLHLIIGPNGAGKSSLIKVLCNQLAPQGGDVLYGADKVTAFSLGAIAKFRSVLSQSIELAFPLTVAEVVMMGRYPHFNGKPEVKDIDACREAMLYFDVMDMAERNYLTLSGGEKQRVQFCRVLSQIWYPMPNHNRYLILDEPLTFLDIYHQFQFMKKIRELLLQKDMVIIGVVHDLNLAAKFADQVVLLDQGRLVMAGSPTKVLTEVNITNVYRIKPLIRKENGRLQIYFDTDITL